MISFRGGDWITGHMLGAYSGQCPMSECLVECRRRARKAPQARGDELGFTFWCSLWQRRRDGRWHIGHVVERVMLPLIGGCGFQF